MTPKEKLTRDRLAKHAKVKTVRDQRNLNVGRLTVCEKCGEFDGVNCKIMGCLGCLKTKSSCPLGRWA